MNETPASLDHSPLGRSAQYPGEYDATLLFPLDRAENRVALGLADGAALPFVGEDEWHAYELSWLNARGKPVVAVGRFRLPADAPNLVESKSFKLYLNSFNQTCFQGHDEVATTLERDLSAIVGGRVDVELLGVDDPALIPRRLPGECIDDLDIAIDDYTPSAEHLQVASNSGGRIVEETLHSHLLKSNCPVTGQPDWGSVMVRYKGPVLDREGLLRYLVGFRQHQGFHEHCVEQIFTDIIAATGAEALLVMARYVRRGGLDISPWRATPGLKPPMPLRLARQ